MLYDENLTAERLSFVTHLECSETGERYPADEMHNLSRAGKPLLVRYDLDGVRKALSKDALARRPADLWRYREFLPVRRARDIVSLGEAVTPLLQLPKLARKLGGGELIVKDEGRLPTGSFKARGLVMAVSMAKALGCGLRKGRHRCRWLLFHRLGEPLFRDHLILSRHSSGRFGIEIDAERSRG